MTDKKTEQAKPQLSQEQIKQLLSMMQTKQQLPTHKKYIQNTLVTLTKLAQDAAKYIDKFIKFVINKEDMDKNDVVQAARGPILFGTYVIIIFFVFGGLWSALAPLDSAATAMGIVIPSSKRKVIQHPRGGIVKGIYVQVGDHVRKGDKILELDELEAKATYETILNQYRSTLANEARLIAERDDKKEIIFDEFLLKDKDLPEVATLLKTEIELFNSKEEAYRKRMEALKQKSIQLDKQLEVLNSRKIVAQKNVEILKDRLDSAKKLLNKGFVNKAQYQEIEGKFTQAESELSSNESEIARIYQAKAQDEAEKSFTDNEYLTRVMDELHKVQVAKNEMREKYIQAKDGYEKVVLRSPVDGTVIEMNPATIGGVLNPNGLPVAEILPTEDRLVIEAKVPSKNIDSVQVGLKVKVRFSAFKSRITPSFNGVVTSLSPDIIQDKQQAQSEPVYLARIEIDMDDFNKVAKKAKLTLKPGMQAEVQIVTGTRTLIKYLLSPISDTMFNSLNER